MVLRSSFPRPLTGAAALAAAVLLTACGAGGDDAPAAAQSSASSSAASQESARATEPTPSTEPAHIGAGQDAGEDGASAATTPPAETAPTPAADGGGSEAGASTAAGPQPSPDRQADEDMTATPAPAVTSHQEASPSAPARRQSDTAQEPAPAAEPVPGSVAATVPASASAAAPPPAAAAPTLQASRLDGNDYLYFETTHGVLCDMYRYYVECETAPEGEFLRARVLESGPATLVTPSGYMGGNDGLTTHRLAPGQSARLNQFLCTAGAADVTCRNQDTGASMTVGREITLGSGG